MPLISCADPIGRTETLQSDSEMKLRFRSKNRETEEFQIANPGVRIMNPSRTKRRIAARSTSGHESPEAHGSERGRVCCGGDRAAAAIGCAVAAGDGGARLLGGDAIISCT
jgi:hypothetical protein